MKDKFSIKGKVNLILRDQYGNVKKVVNKDNLITNTGRFYILSRMFNDSFVTSALSIKFGSGNTTPTLADTDLETPYSTRGAISNTNLVEDNLSDGATITILAPQAVVGVITECGLFVGVNRLISRIVFDEINKAASDTLTINWTYSFV